MRKYDFSSRDQANQSLADSIADILKTAIEKNDRGVLAVSGGSTPIDFFHLLSEKPLPWEKVVVTLADERMVEPTHKDSNEKLVHEHLLKNHAAKAAFVSMRNGHEDGEQAALACDSVLKQIGTLDAVVLGMGGDGHTASLFPGAVALPAGLDANSSRQCIAVTPLTAPYERLSLTLSALMTSGHVFVLIFGEDKAQVLQTALSANDASTYPIAAVLNQERAPVSVIYSD
jgi:6-phosphogluconolactonase